MENEEKQKREEIENREKVFVSVRREEAADEEENLEKPSENISKIPQRWHIY